MKVDMKLQRTCLRIALLSVNWLNENGDWDKLSVSNLISINEAVIKLVAVWIEFTGLLPWRQHWDLEAVEVNWVDLNETNEKVVVCCIGTNDPGGIRGGRTFCQFLVASFVVCERPRRRRRRRRRKGEEVEVEVEEDVLIEPKNRRSGVMTIKRWRPGAYFHLILKSPSRITAESAHCKRRQVIGC